MIDGRVLPTRTVRVESEHHGQTQKIFLACLGPRPYLPTLLLIVGQLAVSIPTYEC